MSRRIKPDPGQRCEHSRHTPGAPERNLQRVYYDKHGKFCYEWWCEACYDEEGIEPMEEEWPTGADGRFMTAVHCPTIPGLD